MNDQEIGSGHVSLRSFNRLASSDVTTLLGECKVLRSCVGWRNKVVSCQCIYDI